MRWYFGVFSSSIANFSYSCCQKSSSFITRIESTQQKNIPVGFVLSNKFKSILIARDMISSFEIVPGF